MHIIKKRMTQLPGNRAIIEISFDVCRANEQATASDFTFKDYPELVIAVPVVNGLHNRLQLARQAIEIDSPHPANKLEPLPVETHLCRETRQCGMMCIAPEA